MQTGFLSLSSERQKFQPERKALGYGGTGLGLTIVRLLANNIGCSVQFVDPEDGFKTAFSILVEGSQVSKENPTILIYDDEPQRTEKF